MEAILALDLAIKCGWATTTASGTWDLRIKSDESRGMRLVRFRAKLREILREEQITLIVFERCAGQHKNPIIAQAELQAIVKLLAEDIGINYRSFSAKEIKSFATGSGNSNKAMMVVAAKEKYGMIGDDDNEADALHLYHLAKSNYQ